MLSAVVLTKNEEKNIVDCLETLAWCDEIVIIDDNSEDRTVEIAQKTLRLHSGQVKVFIHSLNNDFSQQRNFGLRQAQGDWILFIDADERVSEALASEIFNFQFSIFNKYGGFYIKRRDFMWGRELKHGEVGKIKLLRLARKDAGEWRGKVHEEWKVRGRIGELKNPIIHYPHQTITEFLKEINFYTDLRAKELYEQGEKANIFSIILYTKLKFFTNYILKAGFFDGIPGLIFTLMMSFHSFLVRGKLWLLWRKR